MRIVVVASVVLLASGNVAWGDNDAILRDAKICAAVLNPPAGGLARVIEACNYVIPYAVDDDLGRFHRYRGMALQSSGLLRAAIADYDQALGILPADIWSLKGRALSKAGSGDLPGARADYLRLQELDPGNRQWRYEIADVDRQLQGQGSATAQVAPQSPPPVAQPAPGPTPLTPPPAAAALRTAEPGTVATAAPEQPAVDEHLRKIQAELGELGYYRGPATGRPDDRMQEAVAAFVAEQGLGSVGDSDPDFQAALAEAVRLHRQAQADLHRRVQQSLADLGFYEGDIDGQFGSRSRKALQDWLSSTGRAPVREPTEAIARQLEDAAYKQMAQQEKPAQKPPAIEPPQIALAAPAPTSPPAQAPNTAPLTPPEPQVVEPTVPEVPEVQAPQPDVAIVSKSVGPYDLLPATGEAPDKRVALVIGNAKYKSATELINSRNDADDMAAALTALGFEVLKGVDLARDDMLRITKDFARKARNADIAMAYYSGHGMQFDRSNYLLPVDMQLQDEYDLREMVELSQIIADTAQAAKVGLVVVDACRDDPLATQVLADNMGSSRSAALLGEGLAVPKLPPSHSLVAYATAADFVAYDGGDDARNSPFTASLLRNIKTEKLDIRQLFGKVADDVRKATGNKQRPDMWTALGGDPIYLVPGPPDPIGLAVEELSPGEVQLIQQSLTWLRYWSGAEDGIATPELTQAVRSWQRSQFVDDSGQLTPQQIIGLHRTAIRQRPRMALPTADLAQVMAQLGQGSLEAKRTMGMVFDPAFVDGPFPKDRANASTWYQQAALQGDRGAAWLLGEMLVAPDNPLPNREDALKWLDIAAQAGDPNAAVRIAELILERPADAAARARAIKFLQVGVSDPATRGMANALLRHAGEPIAQTATAAP